MVLGPTIRKQKDVKRLYLLRHAKSSWGDPHLSDHDRPLAPRGRRAATRIGRHLRPAGIEPEEVLCSTAARARQTLDAVLPFLDPHVTVHIEDEIYRADSDELLERLREVSPTVASVMLIGHNPGMQELALTLANDGDGDGDGNQLTARLAEKFPTAGLAAFAVPTDEWTELGRAPARLKRFLVPRELG
jgi:phosphohistidine phosphatase